MSDHVHAARTCMTNRWGVVVLAAGAGSRMGGVAKCLIECDGVPVLQKLLQSIHALHPAQTVLVLGHHAHAISRALERWPERDALWAVRNDAPGESPASSLRLGLDAMLAGPMAVDCVMVLLADQPLLTADDLQQARRIFATRSQQQRIVWPVHAGVPGHPVMLDVPFARTWLLQKEIGLRNWSSQQPAKVALWNPGHDHYTTDLDTPSDLTSIARRTGKNWTLPAQDTIDE